MKKRTLTMLLAAVLLLLSSACGAAAAPVSERPALPEDTPLPTRQPTPLPTAEPTPQPLPETFRIIMRRKTGGVSVFGTTVLAS